MGAHLICVLLNCFILFTDIRVAVPGDATFISYKTSLQDYCQKAGWLQPHYTSQMYKSGYMSNLVCGGSQYDSGSEAFGSKQEAEQRAAFSALVGLGIIGGGSKFGVDCKLDLYHRFFY